MKRFLLICVAIAVLLVPALVPASIFGRSQLQRIGQPAGCEALRISEAGLYGGAIRPRRLQS